MNKINNILFTSPISTRSGYGECARDFAKYLFSRHSDSNIKLLSTRWGNCSLDGLDDGSEDSKTIIKHIVNSPPTELFDISFHMTMPNEFKPFGKYNIGLSAGIEADKCSASLIEGCNKMDLVIVPSEFSKETLVNSEHGNVKCSTQVEVIFEGHTPKDSQNDTITHILNEIDEEFCFLFLGQWSATNDRKNVNDLIKTFYKTFRDITSPPALILKLHGHTHCVEDELKIHEHINNIKRELSTEVLPNIYLLYGNLTAEEISQTYSHTKIKCMVSFTRGEGFGRPLLEASMHGLPIVVSKWSGHLDFLNKKYTKLVPGKLVPVRGLGNLVPQDAKWFSVDCDAAANAMLDVFNRYKIYQSRAEKLAEINTREYSLEAMFDEYDKVLKNYLLTDKHSKSNFKTNIP